MFFLSTELLLCHWSFPVQIPICRSDWKPKSKVLGPHLHTHTHTDILYRQKHTHTHQNATNSIPPLFDKKLQYYLADSRWTSAPLLSYSRPPERQQNQVHQKWLNKEIIPLWKVVGRPTIAKNVLEVFIVKRRWERLFLTRSWQAPLRFLFHRWNTMLMEENWSKPFSCTFQHTHLHTHLLLHTCMFSNQKPVTRTSLRNHSSPIWINTFWGLGQIIMVTIYSARRWQE